MLGRKNIITDIKKAFSNAKMVIVTISFIGSTMVGAYTVVSKYFVTKVYAQELIDDVQSELDELKEQTKGNKKILIEMRLIRLENKIARGEELTPTEERVYEKLRKDYEKINTP